ncbi:unnamed protein product, partial [Adineta steineri]
SKQYEYQHGHLYAYQVWMVFSVGSLEGYTGDNNCWVNVVMVPNLSNSKKNGLRNGLLAFLGL